MTTRPIQELFDEMEERQKNPVIRFFYNRSFAGSNTWWWIRHPWRLYEAPEFYLRRLGWMIERGRKGYSVYDTWSLDHYLLKWLPDAIRDLRLAGHGHPMSTTPEEWNEILSKIEAGLRSGQQFLDDFKLTWEESDTAEFEAAWALMGRWFFHLWD